MQLCSGSGGFLEFGAASREPQEMKKKNLKEEKHNCISEGTNKKDKEVGSASVVW